MVGASRAAGKPARVPVPPAVLGVRALRGLWALRVFVLLVSAMVIVAFVAGLH